MRDEVFNVRFSGTNPVSFQNYCLAVWLYYQKVREIDTDNFLLIVPEPVVGGSRSQVGVSGRLMSLDFIQSVDTRHRARNAWTSAAAPGASRVIVELGAGYGRLAYRGAPQRLLPECSMSSNLRPEATHLRGQLAGKGASY